MEASSVTVYAPRKDLVSDGDHGALIAEMNSKRPIKFRQRLLPHRNEDAVAREVKDGTILASSGFRVKCAHRPRTVIRS